MTTMSSYTQFGYPYSAASQVIIMPQIIFILIQILSILDFQNLGLNETRKTAASLYF